MFQEPEYLAYKTQEYKATKSQFEEFMKKPTVRLLISMIPNLERQEIIEALLRESFSAGWECGVGHLSVSVLKKMWPTTSK